MVDGGMKILSFDVGIEQILRSGNLDTEKLPDRTDDLLPSDEHFSHHLDRILQTPTLEHHLLDSLKPEVTDSHILVPKRYRAMIGESHDALKQAAENATTGKETIKEAAHLLEAEKELIDLLGTYRQLLVKA